MANKDAGKNGISTRFKPGQSGNPAGGPKLDPLVRDIKKFTAKEFENLCKRILHTTETEAFQICENPEVPLIDKVVAKALIGAYQTGSFSTLDSILNRTIGKVREKFDIHMKPTVLVKRNGDRLVFSGGEIESEE